VRDGFLREIKSTIILQPGPAALTDGLAAMVAIVAEWLEAQRDSRATVSAR
jgi:iron complex transport system substrate-binding protein